MRFEQLLNNLMQIGLTVSLAALVPLVLRRPPLGHVLSSAHDMRREHRVISALAGSRVPVHTTTPRTISRRCAGSARKAGSTNRSTTPSS